MLCIKTYYSIREVKTFWEHIILHDDSRFYSTYAMNELYEVYRKTSVSNILRGNTKCAYIAAFDKENCVCIAPLCLDVYPQKIITLLGHGTNAAYLDFIYNDAGYVKNLLDYILEAFPEYKISFYFVPSNSPLADILHRKHTFSNFCIKLNDFESWMHDLSKSMRQNIRTSYNRMATDGYSCSLRILNNADPELRQEMRKCNEIYQKRKTEWNRDSGQEDVSKIRSRLFLQRDVIYRALRKSGNASLAELLINGKCCAFFICFAVNGGVLVPRLAIDTNYARYSPGIVLICEYLKQINVVPYNFDLCRGTESYKLKLGGILSETYILDNE